MGAFDSLSSLLSLSCELGENNQQNNSTFMSCAKNQKLERPRTEIIVEVLEMTNMKFKKCQRHCASSFSFTALHLAARKSQSQVAKRLLGVGADVNTRDEVGVSRDLKDSQFSNFSQKSFESFSASGVSTSFRG